MNKVKELRIDSTSWATPARLVNLLDFEAEKLSIKTENNESSTMITHQVRFENGVFYLTINNIKGYISFGNNSKILLDMIFSNDDQKNKYHQVWKEIFKIVNNGNENGNEISLLEKDNKFYLELSLNHFLYKL